jgi:hypothetical protein
MSVNKPLCNKYYICLPEEDPISWCPADANETLNINCKYFSKAFEAMEKSLEESGLIFYLTSDTKRLPSYGQNVVAVVREDEWSRIPTYFHKVRAVFKCYGTHPPLGGNPFLKPSYLNLLALLKFVKAWVTRLPSLLKYASARLSSLLLKVGEVPPVYDIPLGYFNQLDLPIKDIEARRYDVSFAGSIVHEPYSKWSLKRLLGTPKSVSRRKMIAALEKIAKKHQEFKIKLSVTPNLQVARSADARSYSRELMDTKICLVPRGGSLETYRFFEALRYGCVVVTEALPSRWFYDGAPAVRVEDWNDVERILKKLLEDEQLLQREHQRTLEWWRTKCSEEAVGTYVANQLNSLRSSCTKTC